VALYPLRRETVPLATDVPSGYPAPGHHNGDYEVVMTEDEMTVALLPVDTTGLPHIGVAVPKPSIDYSLTRCDRCGRDCWIGPRQNQAVRTGCAKYCYYCVLPHPGRVSQVVTLDPDADKRPRRT
jgi:hypothetical protein